MQKSKKMNKTIFLIILLYATHSFSQVGINTTTPNAQLDIRSSNQITPDATDGILIPKINTFPIVNPTIAQDGMMVYLTTTAGANPSGFYYWKNSLNTWLPLSGTASSGWNLSGNSGTNPSTDFVGTTDNQDLIFKINNVRSGRISQGNTSLGYYSLSNISSGNDNVAVGARTLRNTASGYGNVGIGVDALYNNNSGTNNVAVGPSALLQNNNGSNNIAIGAGSQMNNSSGPNNSIAIGFNNTANENAIAIGYQTRANNENIAIGHGSQANANYTTAIGYLAGAQSNYSTAVGYQAL